MVLYRTCTWLVHLHTLGSSLGCSVWYVKPYHAVQLPPAAAPPPSARAISVAASSSGCKVQLAVALAAYVQLAATYHTMAVNRTTAEWVFTALMCTPGAGTR